MAPPFINSVLCLDVKLIQVAHNSRILQYLCNLCPSGNQLKNISVILNRPGLMFGGMPHLQGALKDCD